MITVTLSMNNAEWYVVWWISRSWSKYYNHFRQRAQHYPTNTKRKSRTGLRLCYLCTNRKSSAIINYGRVKAGTCALIACSSARQLILL